MIGWIIGIVVVLLIVCWVIGTYNGLIKGRIVVDEAFATMDVYLKKRYDLSQIWWKQSKDMLRMRKKHWKR